MKPVAPRTRHFITRNSSRDCYGAEIRFTFRVADITGQSLPVLRACGRIYFIPLSVPPHKLQTELGPPAVLRPFCRAAPEEKITTGKEVQLLGYNLFIGVIQRIGR